MILTKTTHAPKVHLPKLNRVVRFRDGEYETEDQAEIDELLDRDDVHESGTEPEPEPELYDPGAHTVKDVLEHMADVDDDEERARVLAAELAGKDREGIVSALQPAPADPTE